MSYKPDEVTLINYLYGELSTEERRQVEKYLKENPEEAKTIAGFVDTRSIIATYDDKEVIPPVMLQDNHARITGGAGGKYWKIPLAIAASISLLLLVGYFTGFDASLSNEGLNVSFRNDKPKPGESLTLEQMEQLIHKAMEQNLVEQKNEFSHFKEQLHSDYVHVLKDQRSQLTRMVKSQLDQDKDELKKYATSLDERNAELISQYFSTAGIEQQNYMKNLLVDFTNYLEEQWVQDRDFYLNRLIDLKLATDLQQQETEQLLSAIIKSVNNQTDESTTQNF